MRQAIPFLCAVIFSIAAIHSSALCRGFGGGYTPGSIDGFGDRARYEGNFGGYDGSQDRRNVYYGGSTGQGKDFRGYGKVKYSSRGLNSDSNGQQYRTIGNLSKFQEQPGTLHATRSISATAYHVQAIAIRNWGQTHPFKLPNPDAWIPSGHAAADWQASAWKGVSWAEASAWFGWSGNPAEYNYGHNILYAAGSVYTGEQLTATAPDYYQQADALAQTGLAATSNDAQWLQLGIFGIAVEDASEPQLIFQLAVNREGMIRGNAYIPSTQINMEVHGAVDKATQRVAWRVADQQNLLVETGLFNLTQDEGTALTHSGPTKTEQVLLIRFKKPASQK